MFCSAIRRCAAPSAHAARISANGTKNAHRPLTSRTPIPVLPSQWNPSLLPSRRLYSQEPGTPSTSSSNASSTLNTSSSTSPPAPPSPSKPPSPSQLEDLRSFREEIVRLSGHKSFNDMNVRPTIRNQIIFFLGVSTVGFTFAAVNTDVETEHWMKRLSTGWSSALPTNADIARAQYAQLGKDLQNGLERMKDMYQRIPLLLQAFFTKLHVTVAQTYLDNNEGKRICWKICLLNAAIYAVWKIPRLQPWMTVRFMHHPLSGMSYTLLTSMFSHRGLFHLVLNCLALEGFGAAAVHYFSKEQAKRQPDQLEASPKWHFLAFYTSAGIFAGLVSHIVTTKFKYPRAVAQLLGPGHSASAVTTAAPSGAVSFSSALARSTGGTTAASATTGTAAATKAAVSRDFLPSLGASGAVYACVTLTALAFPETEIALLIPPTFPIPIQWGVSGLLLVDIIGVVRGWKTLDHFAHLGGAAFGVLYYAYGPSFWSSLRQDVEDMVES